MNNDKKQTTVLIAEDEKFMSSILRVRFEEAGLQVTVASDGVEAWKLANEIKPDVIVLDLVMPNMDGFDFLTKLRADENLKQTKVVVTSNLGQDDDRQRVMALGVEGYIVKAETGIDQLVEKIKQLVS